MIDLMQECLFVFYSLLIFQTGQREREKEREREREEERFFFYNQILIFYHLPMTLSDRLPQKMNEDNLIKIK